MDNEMQIVASHLASAPVDLGAIFSDLCIDYSEQYIATGESAWIERNGDRFSVVVNSSEPEARKRFSAAHELAHYLLHRDLMHNDGDRMMRHIDRLYGLPVDNPASPFTRQHEVQANRLAAQIVMPGPLVRERHSAKNDVAALAAEFQVSKLAMEIRLKTLGLAS
ncbi:ImmA/IrrE family metallo-endopeptidase [Parasphingorhabdus sp.]|uniref:ImmA/IrrE family metallo-endopeptidase n=1 Tax=Parasphingorhabdus sp. TaxID=2709688 RepID=UPI00300204A5